LSSLSNSLKSWSTLKFSFFIGPLISGNDPSMSLSILSSSSPSSLLSSKLKRSFLVTFLPA
jgi:hypothetical protein